MLARLLHQQGVAGVEKDPRERFADHAGEGAAGSSCRARSWPHAASMSSPRVARMVVEMPAACNTDWKACARAFDGGESGLPSIGFIGIKLTWVRRCPITVISRRACSPLSL